MSTVQPTDHFTTTSVNGNYIYIDKVERTIFHIRPVVGYAKIVAVGGNGNFMFIHDERCFQTCLLANSIAVSISTNNVEPDLYICYNLLTFDKDISKEWSTLYNRNIPKDANYWKAI